MIVYIKSCSYSSTITVKAIGIVRDGQILTSANGHPEIGTGRNIKWIYNSKFVIGRPANQKNNVRANTIYQEFHPDIISSIMSIVNNSISCLALHLKLSKETWEKIEHSKTVSFQLKEETLTDQDLLGLKSQHPNEIHIRVFNKYEEGMNGADWEWWLT